MEQEKHKDLWLPRWAVVILGLSVLVSLAVAIILTSQDRLTLELIVALGLAAIGGLTGPLAAHPSHR